VLIGTSAPAAAFALGDTSEASNCSIAAGGNATNNTLTCNFGLTPEQLKEVTKAAVAGVTGPLLDRIEDIGKRLGVTEDAAKALLRIVGEQTDVPDERLAEVLTKVVTDYKRLQVQAAALNPDNPTARDLVERAKVAITAGQFADAHQLLSQARQAQIAAAQEALKLRDQAQAAADAQLLGAAASAATEGDLEMTARDYLKAADTFKQAATLVPPGHPDKMADYLGRQAEALFSQGDERGDNAALEGSIQTWQLVLQLRPRDRVPLDWAQTQNDLGNALETLGGRESGTARLEEAVAAFHAALEERTRVRVPLDWAMTQSNLGSAEGVTQLVRLAIGEQRFANAMSIHRTDQMSGIGRSK
jgi:tetratricopeptide (TPR) repeat protein